MPPADVALTVFGGAVPELSPEDLPEGASPGNQDVDYQPGAVFTRAGTKNQVSYENLFSTNLTGFGQSLPGANAPDEVAWTTPNNITLNTPGDYASVTFGPSSPSYLQSATNFTNGVTTNSKAFTSNVTEGSLLIAQVQATGTGLTYAAAGSVNGAGQTGTLYTVASAGNASAGNTAYTGTFSPPIPTGQQVCIFGSFISANKGTFTVISCNATTLVVNNAGGESDSNGGFAATALGPINNLENVSQIFFWPDCIGGTETITITATGGSPAMALIIVEVPGAAASNPIQYADATAVSVAGEGTAIEGTSLLTSTGNTYAAQFTLGEKATTIGALTQTVGSSWTQRQQLNHDSVVNTSNAFSDQTVVSAGGSVQAISTLNFTAPWISQTLLITGASGGAAAYTFSQALVASNFGFSIPTTVFVLGLTVEVSGKQSQTDAEDFLTLSLITPSPQGSPSYPFQLETTDSTTTIGTPLSTWGYIGPQLSPAVLNNPAFGVSIVAQTGNVAVNPSFNLSAVKITAWLSPNPPSNFNWVKTYEQTDGAVTTLALDATGVLWQEDAINAPGVFNSITDTIEPNSFGNSVTFDDIEYIALSNLTNGTDVPRLWNGQWLDRVSQVGPGAPPVVTGTASGSAIVSITQNPVVDIPTATSGTSGAFVIWSAGPAARGNFGTPSTPGNVMTFTFPFAYTLPTYIMVGSNIVLSGVQTMNGFNPNSGAMNGGVANPAYYTVTSLPSQPTPGQSYYDGMTIQLPNTGFYEGRFISGSAFQATEATITTSVQVPYLEVGDQMTVAGSTEAAYDGTWTVDTTPNASQLAITATALTGGVATYTFTLDTGTTPAVGQFVTVTGTLNGGGIFNVVNAVITTASANTFTTALAGADISSVAESGNAIIDGTIFTFDPAGVAANPIIGNATGGTLGTSGVLGVGIRKCVCIFQTRNSSQTEPSPYVQFNITDSENAMTVSQIPIGPPNVTSRVLAFTGANGANFFYIELPVTVTSNGQQVTYSSTVVNDNTTTQVSLSFPDSVLLAASAIDIPGNNLFEQIELGSSKGFVSFSNRVIAVGEQNKIQNMLNLSFDGGIGTQSSALNPTQAPTTFPLGWTVDLANGSGGQLLVSPIFGNSYYISNATGSTQALYGMIEQSAYEDQLQTPIVTTNTLYSVRVTARCPSGVTTGSLVMDLYSPSTTQVYGSFTVPLSTMTTDMQIFTGTLLTTTFGAVPNDLLFRLYAKAIPNGGDVEVDRVEPFNTQQPVFSTQLHASYAYNPEAFDQVTGLFGPSQNQQAINGAIVLFDQLYALKERSWFSTSDNGTTEPDQWTWRTVSNKVGTIGISSYDYGESWAVSADRAGLYLFEGGEPIKISQEIQPVWELINWKYGNSIWVRNDATNRRVLIGIPIATPNIYMPSFPVSVNPTTPNVVLAMNYRELNSGAMIQSTGPIRSSFTGRLLSPEPARKWSYWNILATYADFIDRGDNTTPIWLCSGYGDSKLLTFVTGQYWDEAGAINSWYLTYGMVKADEQDAKGLGLHRMILTYLTTLAIGSGELSIWIYPDTPENPLPYVQDTIALDSISYGDLESNINVEANRFFIRYGTNAIGAYFKLSKVVPSLGPSPWTAVRGTQKGSP